MSSDIEQVQVIVHVDIAQAWLEGCDDEIRFWADGVIANVDNASPMLEKWMEAKRRLQWVLNIPA